MLTHQNNTITVRSAAVITTVTRALTIISVIIACVLPLAAAFIAGTVRFVNEHGLNYESDPTGLLIGSAVFLAIAGLARAAQWASEQTFTITACESQVRIASAAYAEVTAPAARFARNKALTA